MLLLFQVSSSSVREVPDAVSGASPDTGQGVASINNPEQRAALLEAELAATKASLATYQCTLQHLAQELASTKQQQQQQQQKQQQQVATSPTPGVLVTSQSPVATQPAMGPTSPYPLTLLTVCTSPEGAEAAAGAVPLSPLGPFAIATMSSQVAPSCSQQDMAPRISGSSGSPGVVAAMQGFPGGSLAPLVHIPTAVMTTLVSPHQEGSGMALASPAEHVAGEHLQPYLTPSVSTSLDLSGGSTELVFPLGPRGILSPFGHSSYSGSSQDQRYSMEPASDVSWSGIREDQGTRSGSITSGTTRYGHPYHQGGYQEQLQAQALHPLQGSYEGSMQQMMQQQHDQQQQQHDQQQQQQQQVSPSPAQQLLPAQGAIGMPAAEGQAHAVMLQQYAAAGMLQDPNAAVAAAGAPAMSGMAPQQELLTAMGGLTLTHVPGSSAAYMAPMPQALPQEWAYVNAQAAAANQVNAFTQARVQAQVLAQVQAAQVAQQFQQQQAQAVALEHHQQQQAFMMQQQFQQQQYSPYAQQLVALASQQHQQSSRRQRQGLPHQSSWPQDAHHKRDSRKQHQYVEKQRTVRSRDDPPDWRRIFVGNIGWWVNEAMLHQWFSAYGTVIDTQVSRGRGWLRGRSEAWSLLCLHSVLVSCQSLCC